MALPNTEILVGAPPLLWSNVHEAFEKINQNFISLDLATGGAAVNLETLSTNVSPAVTDDYALGSDANRWKSVFVGEWNDSVQAEGNGVWLGAAQIRGITGYIDLPAGSRVNGNLIIDPDKSFFKEIQVDNNLSVVATQFSDSFNLLSGDGISMTVSSGSDSIEINNTGILSVSSSSGISVSTVSGATTITNTGVRSLTSTTALPSGRAAGAGINISGATGDSIRVTNTGIISVSSGVGITVSLDSSSGDVTITNSAPAVNSFTQFEIDGDFANRLLADSVSDVLNIRSGQGITLTKTPSTDTLTITVNPVFDLKGSIFGDDSTKIVDAVENKVYAEFFGNLTGDVKGSVFGDDSTKIVDAVENKVYGGIFATTLRTSESKIALGQGAGGDGLQGLESVAIGFTAGGFTQGDYAVAIGSGAGNIGQGNRAIAIGATAGVDQGDYAISIGNSAGYPSAVSGSIAINASGFTLDAPAAGFFVNPIRSTANGRPLMYDTITKELFSSNVLEFFGSRISTSDSSGITVDVLTTFNTDVVVENDLNVTQRLSVQGSRVINLAELKSVVAASTNFSDFQTRIAALV